jgi:anti-sigma B factor antagonist
MKFTDSLEDHVAVFVLSGKIMGGEETTLFYGRVREHINGHARKFLIDLKDVVWINSIGLGMLISAMTTIRNAEGKLVLTNITTVESLLTLTRLVTVFDTADSREEGLEFLREELV